MDNPLPTSSPQTVGNTEDFGYYRGNWLSKKCLSSGYCWTSEVTLPQVVSPQPVARYKLTKFQMALRDITIDLMKNEDNKLIEFIDNNNSRDIRRLLNVPLLEDSVTINYTIDSFRLLPQVRVTYTRNQITNVRDFLKAVGEFYDSPLTEEQLLDVKNQDTPDDDESSEWCISNWANAASYISSLYQSLSSEPVYNSLFDMKGTLTSIVGFNISPDGSYDVELDRVSDHM